MAPNDAAVLRAAILHLRKRLNSLWNAIDVRTGHVNSEVAALFDDEHQGMDGLQEWELVSELLESLQTQRTGRTKSLAAGSDPKEGSALEDFFDNVASGLLGAQRDLDRRSREYLEHVQAASPHVLPSVYRIPKAQAEFTFGIESVEKKKFNLIVVGSEDTKRKQMQHKVSFDVVSVPPPEGWRAAPQPFLLQGRMQRDLVLSELGKLVTGTGARAEVAREMVARFAAVLVFRCPSADQDIAQEQLLLVLPRDSTPHFYGLGVVWADWTWDAAPITQQPALQNELKACLIALSAQQESKQPTGL